MNCLKRLNVVETFKRRHPYYVVKAFINILCSVVYHLLSNIQLHHGFTAALRVQKYGLSSRWLGAITYNAPSLLSKFESNTRYLIAPSHRILGAILSRYINSLF